MKNKAFFVIGIMLSLILSSSVVNAISSTNLVGYWNFDNDTTTIQDIHSNLYNLTKQGTPVWEESGKEYGAFNLSITNSMISPYFTNKLNTTTSFCLSKWAKYDSTLAAGQYQWEFIFKNAGSNYGFAFLTPPTTFATQIMSATNNGGGLHSGTPFTPSKGAWHHFVFCRDNSAQRMIIWEDGSVLINESPTWDSPTAPFVLEINDNGGASGMDGPHGWDEMSVWNTLLHQQDVDDLYNSGTGCFYDCIVPPPEPTPERTWGIYVDNLYNDTDLPGVNVTFSTGCYNTTDSSGFAQVSNFSTGCIGISGTLSSVNLSLTGYLFNETSYTIVENSTSLGGGYQGVFNITSITRLIDGAVLGAGLGVWTVNTSGGKTYAECGVSYPCDIYLINGSNNITLEYSGAGDYYDLIYEVNITAPETTTGTVNGVYDSLLSINATDQVTTAPILTFTIAASNSTQGYSVNVSTTTGNALIPWIQGISSFLLIDASGYAYRNTSLITNDSLVNYNFELYVMNTFILTIYDETTNQQINDTNFTILFISDIFSTNTTYSGTTIYEELLIPGEYEIRYYEEGENTTYSDKRSYFVLLNNKSYENIRIYSIQDDISGYYTPTLLTSSGYYAQDVIMKAYRGYIENETLVGYVVDMSKTDPNGQAVFRIEPNNVFYKFTGTSGNERFETNYFKITQETHTFQLSEGGLLSDITLGNSEPYNLSFISSTDSFRVTWEDDSNAITQGCLIINKYNRSGEENVVDSCSISSSGSIAYVVTDKDESTYMATAKLSTSTGTLTDSVSHSYKDSYKIWGLMGVFLTLLVFIFAISMGSTAEGVVINGTLALILMSLIGIFAVEWSAIVGIVIIAGVIIYKTKS